MPLEKKKEKKQQKERKHKAKQSKAKKITHFKGKERKKGSKSCTKVDNFTLQDTQIFPQNIAHKIIVVVVEMCFESSSLRDHYCLLLFFPFCVTV